MGSLIIMINHNEILKKNFYYLDFESNKAGDLFLLGLEHNKKFTCYVINKDLSCLCDNEEYKNKYNIKFEHHKTLINNLLRTINENNGIVVAYSIAELEIIQSLVGNESLPNILYLNLARAARSWKNKFHKNAFDLLPEFRKHSNNFIAKKNSLASIMRLLPSETQAPSDYAPGKTTSRINDVIKGFKAKKEFSKLTPVQKGKATKLLKHNYFDVTSLRVLLNEIINKDPSRLNKAIYSIKDIKSKA